MIVISPAREDRVFLHSLSVRVGPFVIIIIVHHNVVIIYREHHHRHPWNGFPVFLCGLVTGLLAKLDAINSQWPTANTDLTRNNLID